MKVAAVHAIRELAKEPVPREICNAYGVDSLEFGKEYIIPKPMDVRLLEVVPAAVARAAVDSGVAGLPYPAHYPLKSMDDRSEERRVGKEWRPGRWRGRCNKRS